MAVELLKLRFCVLKVEAKKLKINQLHMHVDN